MTKLTGGGINSRVVSNVSAPKREPVSHSVSVGAVSRLGGILGVGTKFKPFYNGQGYSTPSGPTPGLDARPGGNGREIMRAGSQSKTPAPRPMGKGRSLFD
jgi:hypothetical protein